MQSFFSVVNELLQRQAEHFLVAPVVRDDDTPMPCTEQYVTPRRCHRRNQRFRKCLLVQRRTEPTGSNTPRPFHMSAKSNNNESQKKKKKNKKKNLRLNEPRGKEEHKWRAAQVSWSSKQILLSKLVALFFDPATNFLAPLEDL